MVIQGGRGTAMRHGVPMVVVPGLAGDQPFVAAAVQEWDAGVAPPAAAARMRAAAEQVLSTPSATKWRASARRRSPASTAPRMRPTRSSG
jgi:UDP:flavonoid glycosyltransferase YjiC (YdhE family)